MNAADLIPTTPRRGRTQAQAADDDAPSHAPGFRGEGACAADRCPCRGTTIREGRSWCTWHARAAGEAYMGLSEHLIDQQPLIDLIGELMRIHRFAKQSKAWVHRAERFFAGDEAMKPTEHERKHIGGYLWRLTEEIAFRCGVESHRPAPQVPHCQDPAWMSPRQREIALQAGGAGLPTLESALSRQKRVQAYAEEQGQQL